MPQYQVTQQPQAIFINGDPAQEPMTIKNEGPFTVWADSDSSVNAERSIPIPPKGTLGWDGGRALWMVGKKVPSDGLGSVVDSTSLVNITRNSSVPNYNYELVETIYRDASQTLSFGDPWRMPYAIECSSYQSLIIVVVNPDFAMADQAAPAAVYGVGVTWLDKNGNMCAFDQFNMMPQSDTTPTFLGTAGAAAVSPDGNNHSRANVRIKGHYAIVRIENTSGTSSIPDVSLVGSTRELDERVVFKNMDALPHPCDALSPIGLSLFNIGNDVFDFDWGNFAAGGQGMAFTSLLLPQIGTRLRLTFTWTATVTTAGILRFFDPFNGTNRFDVNATIPAASAGVSTVEFRRPKGIPLRMSWNVTPKQGGGATELQQLFTIVEYLD